MTEKDTIRLLETRHDILAVADPAALTDSPVYRRAVAQSRDELGMARAELVEKVALNTVESSETDTERARVQRLLSEALEHYRYYRGRTEDALLNPPPEHPLSAEELNRRQRLYTRYYGQNASDLGRVGFAKQIEVLDALLTAYQSENELEALGHLPHLQTAFRPAIAAIQELQREIQQDRAATETLDAARNALDRAHRAHTQWVESLLIRAGREDDAGHFIKRRQPAYAARRRAKTSVAQEPEAETIDSEILSYHPVFPA